MGVEVEQGKTYYSIPARLFAARDHKFGPWLVIKSKMKEIGRLTKLWVSSAQNFRTHFGQPKKKGKRIRMKIEEKEETRESVILRGPIDKSLGAGKKNKT